MAYMSFMRRAGWRKLESGLREKWKMPEVI